MKLDEILYKDMPINNQLESPKTVRVKTRHE